MPTYFMDLVDGTFKYPQQMPGQAPLLKFPLLVCRQCGV